MEKIDSNETNDKMQPKMIVGDEVMPKIRRKKRKRGSSDSCSDNEQIVLSENTQQVENSNSVKKSNPDDTNVKHISKKVATNDHDTGVGKLKKKDYSTMSVVKRVQPKLTRSKVKELMLISPKSAPVDFFNMDLTPIKHIHVKTRPEVKALIAQELPEDEDDEEYRPTHESDDDHDQTLESCSEPGTPHGPAASPALPATTDGSFKMPQDVSGAPPPQSAEEATIARRTRSKLCLSETPIEHIESSFVPPDEVPLPAPDVDWMDFLARCRDPAPASARPEDDDDADPEYNAAADPDAQEDEEDLLEMFPRSISKKEVNDLITELCHVMTDAQNYQTSDWVPNIAAGPEEVVSVNAGQWREKMEPPPDSGEAQHQEAALSYQECNDSRISIDKTEPGESAGEGGGGCEGGDGGGGATGASQAFATNVRIEIEKLSDSSREQDVWTAAQAQIALPPGEECAIKGAEAEAEAEAGAEADEGAGAVGDAAAEPPPPPVLRLQALRDSTRTSPFADGDYVAELLPEQRLILEQQLRQHVQLAASNYLQLCTHPVFYGKAPVYKGFLDELHSMAESRPRSVVDVCNLRPARELAATWQRTVSSATPENTKMVQFVQEQFDRNRRRAAQCSLYVGDFPETLQQVIANSPVFLYPSLLPPLPYRGENTRRNSYLRSEDELLALYLDEDWQYVEANPALYPRPKQPASGAGGRRWGLRATMDLVCKRVPRWITPKTLHAHIRNVRRCGDRTNPIYRFLQNREITPVKHKLLPFNPEITLYEQPEHEVPKIWLRYLAKTSKRFRNYLYRRSRVGPEPEGVPVDFGTPIEQPKRNPLPIDFTNQVPSHETALLAKRNLSSRIDLHIATSVGETPATGADQSVLVAENVYSVVETESGSYLVPVCVQTNRTGDKVPSDKAPAGNLTEESPSKMCVDFESAGAVAEVDSRPPEPPDGNGIVTKKAPERCKCFALLRKIGIKDVRKATYPRVSDKLRTLVSLYKSQPRCALEQLKAELKQLKKRGGKGARGEDAGRGEEEGAGVDVNTLAFAISYQTRLSIATDIAKYKYMKKRIYNIFSRFNPEEDSPLKLAEQLFKVFHVELIDMYKEFMGFLTAEQADKLGRFADYFNCNCLDGLMRKIEECIPGRRERRGVLAALYRLLCDNSSTACQICRGVLSAVRRRPGLARHVFQLFPHTGHQDANDEVVVKQESEESDDACEAEQAREAADARFPTPTPEAPLPAECGPQLDTSEENVSLHTLQIRNNTTNTESGQSEERTVIKQECEEETQPNEAENLRNELRPNIESNEESMTVVSERESVNTTVDPPRTNEITAVNQEQQPSTAETQVIIDNHKNERQHSIESSEESLIVVSEVEHVKTEASTWKRDEDKLILEMIKETTLTYEHDKTLIELMEEQNQIQLISDSLVDKSQQDVRARVLFLIQKITRIGAPT